MFRGFFAGGLTGFLVGGVGLVVASLVTEQPAGNQSPTSPQMAADLKAQAPTTELVAPETIVEPVISSPDTIAPANPEKSLVPSGSSPLIADIASAEVPSTSVIEGSFQNPDIAVVPDLEISLAEPVLPSPTSVAPNVPITENGITLSTKPAEPITNLPDALQRDEVAIVEQPEIPSQPDLPKGAGASALEFDGFVIVPDSSLFGERRGPDLESGASEGPDSVETRDIATDIDDENLESSEQETVFPEGTPALVRFAAQDVPDVGDKVKIAILLLDSGNTTGGVEAISSLGFPATVIIDPIATDAAARAVQYRQAGIEVGLRTLLPDQPTERDVAVSLAATMAQVPEAVVLLDAGEGGLQNRQKAVEQAMQTLNEGGLGFVSLSKGLNTAMRIAEKSDVPSTLIFRDLDAGNQDAEVISRFIDQAAFRARRDGEVVLLGRVRVETLRALVLWQLSRRAQGVALVPISTLLAPEQDETTDLSPDAQIDPELDPDQN